MTIPFLKALAAVALALAPVDASTFDVMDRRMPSAAKTAIAEAVNADAEWPLTGSKRGDALLVAVYMQHESFFKRDAKGDHGSSLGSLQLQRVPLTVAFNYRLSVEEWLRRAHLSATHCSGIVSDEGELLSELTSGNCWHGHVVARTRSREATALLASLEGED